MQVATLTSNVSIANTGSTTGFRVEANAFAFRALADGMYSNKIGSIVREVACNALDSHAEAGWPERPIVIHLPDTFYPTFEVHDTGIGLDDYGVRSTFCTLFGSTKRNSNLSVGAFGLGSKTPFSYTDQFNIRAVKDGKVRVYSAYLNAEGCPDITNLGGEFSRTYWLCDGVAYNSLEDMVGLTAEQREFILAKCEVLDQWNETDAPNGVSIILPVTKSEDFSRFRNEVRTQLAFFPVKPVIHNYEPGIAWQDFTGNSYMDFDRIVVGDVGNSNLRGLWVLQGPVGYKADMEQLKTHLSPENREFLDIIGASAMLKFNIGDIEVTPAREALSYSARTIAAIEALLDTGRAEIRDRVQAMIDGQGDNWQTALYLNGNNTIRRLARLTGANWGADHYYHTTAGWYLDLASVANVDGMATGEEEKAEVVNPDLDPSQVSLGYDTPWNGVADADDSDVEGEEDEEEELEEEEEEDVRDHYSLRLPIRFRAYVYERKGGRRSRKYLWKAGDIGRSAKVDEDLVVLAMDTDEKAERRRRIFMEELAQSGSAKTSQVFVLQRQDGSPLTAAEIAKVQARIGASWTPALLSEVELPEPKKRGSGYSRAGYKVPTGYVYPGYGDIYNSSNWQRSQDKLKSLEDGAYYVIVERHRTNTQGSDSLVFDLAKAGLLDKPIIGIRQKDAEKLAGNPDWVSVRAKAASIVESVRNHKTLHNAYLLSRCSLPSFDITDTNVFVKLREMADAGKLPKDSPLHKLFRLQRTIARAKARGESRCLTSFTRDALRHTGLTFDEMPMENAIAERAKGLVEAVNEAYPLLTYFRSHHYNRYAAPVEQFEHIASYVMSRHAGA